MLFIREGATIDIPIGPFVAVGDGFTPVTNFVEGSADEAEAILHDNGTVVDISAYTLVAITTADGWYHLTLQTGISNTVGHVTIVYHDDSLCLPVFNQFTVIEATAYDAMFKSGATIGDDLILIRSDTSDVLSALADATIGLAALETIASDTESNVVVVAADVQLSQSEISQIHSRLVVMDAELTVISDQVVTVESEVSEILVDTSTTLEDFASDTKSILNDATVGLAALEVITSNTHSRLVVLDAELTVISDQVASVLVDTTPLEDFASDTYSILTDATIGLDALETIASDTESNVVVAVAAIATIESEVSAILVDTGTTLENQVASILVDTKTTLQNQVASILVDTKTTLPAEHTIIRSDTSDVLSRLVVMDAELTVISDQVAAVESEVSQILSDTTAIHTQTTAIPSDVNAEVLDVLNVDTFAELSGIPAASSSIVDKVNWLFALARNKLTETSTTLTVRNDADSGDIAAATVSDDATTATRGEFT